MTAARAGIRVLVGHWLSDEARCLLYVPFAQALAYHWSVGAGLDPDRPEHHTHVVHPGDVPIGRLIPPQKPAYFEFPPNGVD